MTVYLNLYSKKLSTIASGDTPIGSAGCAPDTDESINFKILRRRSYYTYIRVNYRLHYQKIMMFDIAIH
jgi:hypothetical protein